MTNREKARALLQKRHRGNTITKKYPTLTAIVESILFNYFQQAKSYGDVRIRHFAAIEAMDVLAKRRRDEIDKEEGE